MKDSPKHLQVARGSRGALLPACPGNPDPFFQVPKCHLLQEAWHGLHFLCQGRLCLASLELFQAVPALMLVNLCIIISLLPLSLPP